MAVQDLNLKVWKGQVFEPLGPFVVMVDLLMMPMPWYYPLPNARWAVGMLTTGLLSPPPSNSA